MGSMVWRVLGTGSAVLAGLVATKVVDAFFKRAGADTTQDPKNPDVPAKQAMAYAAVTGLAVAAAKTLATRKAAAYYAKSSGHLPAAFQAEESKDRS